MFYSVITHSCAAAVLSLLATGVAIAAEADDAPVEAEVVVIENGVATTVTDVDAVLEELGLSLEELTGSSGPAAPGQPQARCMVVSRATAVDGQPCAVAAAPFVQNLTGGLMQIGQSAPTVIQIAGDAARVGRGWLGISIGQVPASLAAQLDTGDAGVIVLNVVEDSPADQAGLVEHDIILSINGTQIESAQGNIMKAVDMISSNDPGATVSLDLLRGGEAITLDATLGARPTPATMDWKFDMPPLAEIEEDFSMRGRMMIRDQDGNWTFKDLGDLNGVDVFQNLPDEFQAFVPDKDHRAMRVYVDGNRKSVTCKIIKGGENLEIEQSGDGPIIVRRSDDAGDSTETVYETEEELRDADTEAYELFHSSGTKVFVAEGEDADHIRMFDVDIDASAWQRDMDAWQSQMETSLEEARQGYAEALRHVEALKQGGSIDALLPLMSAGEVKNTFEVRPDGTIEARTRKDDAELVRLYTDEQDLAQRNPSLHQKFAELMEVADK